MELRFGSVQWGAMGAAAAARRPQRRLLSRGSLPGAVRARPPACPPLGSRGTVSSDPLSSELPAEAARPGSRCPETPRRPSCHPPVPPCHRGSLQGRRGPRVGGPVRAPRRTHTHPLLAAGELDGQKLPSSRDARPGGCGALAGRGPPRAEGRWGRRPRGGGGRPPLPSARGLGSVCTPLRRSRSSADGWDLKFFLPLWKSGRMGGVAMTTAPSPCRAPPPLFLEDAPTTLVLFRCHVMDAHRPPHLPFPCLCHSVFLFGGV